jgi:hypothetical protein
MVTIWRGRSRRALVPLPAVAVLGCVAVASCGSAAVASQASSTTVNGADPVCTYDRQVDSLTVSRGADLTASISASRRGSQSPKASGHGPSRRPCAHCRR